MSDLRGDTDRILEDIDNTLNEIWGPSGVKPTHYVWTGSDEELRAFYQRLIGRAIDDDEWVRILDNARNNGNQFTVVLE